MNVPCEVLSVQRPELELCDLNILNPKDLPNDLSQLVLAQNVQRLHCGP